MKRQFAKGLTMLMLVVGLALASAVVANGQSGRQVTAKVPFDFIVSNRTFRAGHYDVINVNGAGDTLAVREADSNEQAMLVTSSIIANNQRDLRAKLVFHRYGETYFLSQVWLAGRSNGRVLAKTKQERAIERELNKIAAYHGDTKPVYEVVEIVLAGN